MRVLKILAMILIFGVFLLTGCGIRSSAAITGIVFNRGHGSAWGNQFYIEICSGEILLARYIPEGGSELVTLEHIPITQEQWQSVLRTVEQLPLEKARTNLWEKQKVDGSEFRELTLVRGKKETTYWWPNIPQAQQLEQLLEGLLADSIEPVIFYTGQFSVAIPAGWKGFAVEDAFSNTPGAYREDRINIIRGGIEPSDIKSKIYIMVECFEPGETMEIPTADCMEDASPITPFQTGPHCWQGYTGTDMQGSVRLGTGAVLWTQEGQQRYIVSFPLQWSGQTLTLEDRDLLAILESLSPYGER